LTSSRSGKSHETGCNHHSEPGSERGPQGYSQKKGIFVIQQWPLRMGSFRNCEERTNGHGQFSGPGLNRKYPGRLSAELLTQRDSGRNLRAASQSACDFWKTRGSLRSAIDCVKRSNWTAILKIKVGHQYGPSAIAWGGLSSWSSTLPSPWSGGAVTSTRSLDDNLICEAPS
jgi:hypothetical protein